MVIVVRSLLAILNLIVILLVYTILEGVYFIFGFNLYAKFLSYYINKPNFLLILFALGVVLLIHVIVNLLFKIILMRLVEFAPVFTRYFGLIVIFSIALNIVLALLFNSMFWGFIGWMSILPGLVGLISSISFVIWNLSIHSFFAIGAALKEDY
jgi:hypothetical protein